MKTITTRYTPTRDPKLFVRLRTRYVVGRGYYATLDAVTRVPAPGCVTLVTERPHRLASDTSWLLTAKTRRSPKRDRHAADVAEETASELIADAARELCA